MRFAFAAFAALAVAGCSTTPDPGTESDVEKSEKAIRTMLEEVIAAMRDNKPEVYFDHLCERDKRTRPLPELIESFEEEKMFNREMALSMSVHRIAVGERDIPERDDGSEKRVVDPNIASFVINAPNHPKPEFRWLMGEAIRENGVWKIREAWKPVTPKKTESGSR